MWLHAYRVAPSHAYPAVLFNRLGRGQFGTKFGPIRLGVGQKHWCALVRVVKVGRPEASMKHTFTVTVYTDDANEFVVGAEEIAFEISSQLDLSGAEVGIEDVSVVHISSVPGDFYKDQVQGEV